MVNGLPMERYNTSNDNFDDGTDRLFNFSLLQVVQSVSPATGQVIAEVRQGNVADYQLCVEESRKAWSSWADMPAPKRGEIVRQIGEALRDKLEPLGKLVSMEMGQLVFS